MQYDCCELVSLGVGCCGWCGVGVVRVGCVCG